jgi:sialate O-acetylesterase
MKNRILYVLFFLAAICSFHAKVRLPALVSDGMILQRNQDLKIWGYADAGEKITVNFINKAYHTTADQNGNWSLMLPKRNAGGPYAMTINEITLKDILIGDVWVAWTIQYGTSYAEAHTFVE